MGLAQQSVALHLSMGDLIHQVARGVAQAQEHLDHSSFLAAERMVGSVLRRHPESGESVDALGRPTETPELQDTRLALGFEPGDGPRRPRRFSLFELGFTPTFYQFVDTTVELRLAMTVGSDQGRTALYGAGVDGTYSGTFGFDAALSSVVRTRLVPVPPPSDLQQRVETLAAQRHAVVPSPTNDPPLEDLP